MDQLTGTALQTEIVATITNVMQLDGIETGDFIRIARFIGELDAARDDINEAFRQLLIGQVIALAPESNTKVITAKDKAAAMRFGSEDLHLVALQP